MTSKPSKPEITYTFTPIELPTSTCLRCGNTWMPRTQHPKQCPKCKSPYWNKPRRTEVKK